MTNFFVYWVLFVFSKNNLTAKKISENPGFVGSKLVVGSDEQFFYRHFCDLGLKVRFKEFVCFFV